MTAHVQAPGAAVGSPAQGLGSAGQPVPGTGGHLSAGVAALPPARVYAPRLREHRRRRAGRYSGARGHNLTISTSRARAPLHWVPHDVNTNLVRLCCRLVVASNHSKMPMLGYIFVSMFLSAQQVKELTGA